MLDNSVTRYGDATGDTQCQGDVRCAAKLITTHVACNQAEGTPRRKGGQICEGPPHDSTTMESSQINLSISGAAKQRPRHKILGRQHASHREKTTKLGRSR